ncbi:MAG: hypothetical protein WBQ95_16935 [Terracidiphilus sp.]
MTIVRARNLIFVTIIAVFSFNTTNAVAQAGLSVQEASQIAKEAYIYAFLW